MNVRLPSWVRVLLLVIAIAAAPRFLASFWFEWVESARVRHSHAYTHARCVDLNSWSHEPSACDTAARVLAVSGFFQVFEASIRRTPWCLGYHCGELLEETGWVARIGVIVALITAFWRPRVTRAIGAIREKRRRDIVVRKATSATAHTHVSNKEV